MAHRRGAARQGIAVILLIFRVLIAWRHERGNLATACSRSVMIRRAILFCVTLLAAGPCLAAEPTAETARQTFRDCPECPEMIVVPAGTFKMGSSQAEL